MELAATLGLGRAEVEALRELGTDLNYGSFGETEADVLMPAIETYRLVSRYRDPLQLGGEPFVAQLARERRADLQRLEGMAPRLSGPFADAYVLPDAPWSRRVMGTFANDLANAIPGRAHAVLVPNSRGGYAASVRSPGGAGPSAAQFCHLYPGGGGRARAAGLDHLAPEQLEQFLSAFADAWSA